MKQKIKQVLILSVLMSALSIPVISGTQDVSFNAMVTNSTAKKTVKNVLKDIDGVKKVKIDGKKGIVAVFYDDRKTNVSIIQGAMNAAGIYATSIGENCALKPGGCLNNMPTTTNTMK